MLLRKYADLLLVLVALSWGSTFILVKKAIMDLPAFSFLSIRFFFAFLFMFVIFFKKLEINSKILISSTILGSLNFGAYALQTISLYFLPSNIVAFLTGLFVIFTPINAYLFFKKKISKKTLFSAVLAFTGIFLLTHAEINFSFYVFLVILCAFLYALHINFTDIFSKKYNIFSLVTFQFLVVSLLSAVFAPFEKTHGFHFTFTVIFALFITVAFATVFAFFVQTYAQRFTTPTKTAVIFALEPVCAAFLGVFFGETLLIRQIIGGALVIVSMILAEI